MMNSIRLLILLAVIGCSGICVAQSVSTDSKTIAASRIDSPPVIDGVLDDAVWDEATVVEDLHVFSPVDGGVPSEETRFLLLVGEDAIYVGAELTDREPDKIVAKVLRQGDFSEGDDGVTVILDPFNQGRSGYAFYLMPNAVRAQALYTNVTNQNWNWDGIWHAETRLTENGWIAEIEIPFNTLSFDPANDTWGINFARKIGRWQERIGWVSHNRAQNPASSGLVTGMEGLEQGLGIDIIPGVRISSSKDFQSGESSTDFEPSFDLTYKPTPALTAALTYNTDFSGTSADERQVNLTRFSLFFPEKRKFFLQDMDIFEFGGMGSNDQFAGGTSRVTRESGRPFFSRRIGLSSTGQAIDIDGGLKLTGRVGGWDYGLLGIRQDQFGDVDADELMVGRVSANVLEESAVGMVATIGNPTSNNDNSLVGADFRYLNTRLANGKTLQGSLWYQQTDTPGLDGDDSAFGLSLNAPNTEGWSGDLVYKEIDDNFRPALGFVDQTGVRNLLAEAAYTWRPDSGPLRTIKSGFRGKRVETLDGDLDIQELNFDVLQIANHTGDNIAAAYMMFREQLVSPFEISEGVVLPPGLYEWGRYCLRGGTGAHRELSFFGWACSGDFYDGTRDSYGPRLTWRPNKHLSMMASYQINDIELPYGSFTTRQITLQADVAFTSTWYWENLIQYDNVSDSLGVNSIMRWVPQAGRELVFVINRELLDPEERRSFKTSYSELVAKFNYTFRF
jgi:hypothetical protein